MGGLGHTHTHTHTHKHTYHHTLFTIVSLLFWMKCYINNDNVRRLHALEKGRTLLDPKVVTWMISDSACTFSDGSKTLTKHGGSIKVNKYTKNRWKG